MRIAHLESMLKNAGIVEDQPQSEPLFSKFLMHFNPKQLAFLRSIDTEKRADASFVRTCLEYIYGEDLTVLQKKSTNGASKRVVKRACGVMHEIPATEPITPEKYIILKNIFAERISSTEECETIREGRNEKLNILVGKAISNIRIKNNKMQNN